MTNYIHRESNYQITLSALCWEVLDLSLHYYIWFSSRTIRQACWHRQYYIEFQVISTSKSVYSLKFVTSFDGHCLQPFRHIVWCSMRAPNTTQHMQSHRLKIPQNSISEWCKKQYVQLSSMRMLISQLHDVCSAYGATVRAIAFPKCISYELIGMFISIFIHTYTCNALHNNI